MCQFNVSNLAAELFIAMCFIGSVNMLLNVLAWVDGAKMLFIADLFFNISVLCLVWCRTFFFNSCQWYSGCDWHLLWACDNWGKLSGGHTFRAFFNASDTWCLPNLGVIIRINTSLLQIFYFVGFALFCLETLLSIGVLQVWKFFPLNSHHSATLTFQCFCKLVDVPLCNNILDEQSFFGTKVWSSRWYKHFMDVNVRKKSTYTLRYPRVLTSPPQPIKRGIPHTKLCNTI